MGLKKTIQESKLVIALVFLVLTRSVDRVYNTRITFYYSQYLWYFSNIINPVAFQFFCWPVVWYKLYYTKDITPEMRAVPHYKFIIMSFLDMCANLLSTVPIPHIGGNLSNVLGQVSLPFTMILSRLFLQTQYKRAHAIGAVMVLYGAFVCMIPIFRGEVALNSPDPSVLWISIYIFSCLPSAGANVYKEIGMKDVDLDVWYANAWISFYQVGWGIVTLWTIRLNAFSDPPVEWADFPSYIASAHNCFFGEPTIFNGVSSACDGGIFVTYVQYIVFNIVFNMLMMYIFREGSSVMFVISSAVCLPLTDFLYMIPALAGPRATQKFTIFDGFALFIIVLGMLVYHSEKEERGTGKDREVKSPMFTSPSVRRLKAGVQFRRKKTTKIQSSGYGAISTTEDAVRITYDYQQFLWYYSNIINPIAFLFISWPVVLYKIYRTDDITPEMKSFPHYKFAIMAFLDMSNSFLSAFPTPHIGGNLANVLSQVTLPFTMILSVWLLGTHYHKAHLMGAIMVIYGAFVCMIPIFRGEVALNSPDPTIGWLLLYVVAMIPSATSNVYKEIGLKDVDLDIWYANAWVSTYQLLWGVVTFWTIEIKAFSDPPVTMSDFPSYISAAHNCFFGQRVEFNGVVSPCDGGIFTIYLQYIVFNVVYNMLMMYVFKEGSSVLFVISSAVCLPLTDILYMIPLLAGPLATQKFTIFDGFALFIIMMGMIVYHSEREERGKDHLSKSPMYSSPSVQRMKLNVENKRGGLRSGVRKLSRSNSDKRTPRSSKPVSKYGSTDAV